MDMTSGGRITDTGARTGHYHPADEIDALAATAIEEQGDLLVGTGPGTYERLPIGPPGAALVAQPQSPTGTGYAQMAPLGHTHTQVESHDQVDTDVNQGSIHHTLGTGPFQAAAGDHTHDIFPVGGIIPFAGPVAPAGWLVCDGSVVAREDYPQLWAVCGTAYGAATETTFRLPDLRTRIPLGYSAADADTAALGQTGGNKAVTLIEANLPSHTHSTPAHGHNTTAHNHTTANHNHTTQSHTHTGASHTHSTPDHTHTVSQSNTGSHGHSVGVSVAAADAHSHDLRVRTATNFDRTGSSAGAVLEGTNQNNFTAPGGGHGHTVTVTQSNTGDHGHSVSISSSGAGTSGSASPETAGASVTVNDGSVTVNSATVVVENSGAGITGSAGSGTPVSVLSPYVTLNYIIKAA